MNSLAIYDIFYKYCSISETGEFYLINPKFDSPYDISADIDDMIREEEANADCICREICDENIYVERVTLNGKELKDIYITHDELMKGGELVFTMSGTA